MIKIFAFLEVRPAGTLLAREEPFYSKIADCPSKLVSSEIRKFLRYRAEWKLAGPPYASALMCAQKSWWERVGERGGRRGGGDGPHYKFNLTNGSENLETMEYMKCGRVYHDGRHGVVPTAILSGPIHILW